MAGPKITRLDDPNNPYNVKKTPTAAPSAAQQALNKARSDALRAQSEAAALKPKAIEPAGRPVQPIMRRANDEYMAARKRAINKAMGE